MTEQAAKGLAAVLGGDAVFPMPGSRSWGVTLERPDGHFAMIEDSGGWLYRDRSAMEAFHRDGDNGGLVAAHEWDGWDSGESWARALAGLISGEAYQSGGNIWVVLLSRPDGKFVVVGLDGADIYQSAAHYEGYYDGNWPEPDFVYWEDSAAKA